MPDGDTSLIGLLLGNFRITAVLGQGAMGAVYEAQHVSLPTKAAVKVLLGEFASDQTAVERFLREAHTASSINDPHIVRIFDAGRLPDGRPYLVMDLLEGGTLADALLQGPLELRRGIEIVRQIASAVAVVHEHGILHRDLKPSNVHLGRSRGAEIVKVLDFGLARPHGLDQSVTTAGTILGTPLYMSPEQADAKPVGPASDVYALGCIAYEVLSGQPPFLGDSVVTVMHKHLTEAPPSVRTLRPGLPPALDPLVRRCLAKAQAERPTAAELATGLAQVLQELDRSGLDATMAAPSTSPAQSARLAPSLAQTAAAVAPATGAPDKLKDSNAIANAAVGGTIASTGPSTAAPRGRGAVIALGLFVVAAAAGAVLYARHDASKATANATVSPETSSSSSSGAISDEKNPFSVNDVATVETGRAIWVSHCAGCHGTRGDGAGTDIPKGVHPKAFCDVVLPPGTLDVYYFGIIRHGVERGGGVAMPAFDKKLSTKESWQVVTFINTLRPKVHKVDVDKEIAAGAPPVDGEQMMRGTDLFYTRCSTCHGEDGKGDGAAASLFPTPPPDLKDDAWSERTLKPGDDDLAHVFRILTLGSGEYMGSFSSLSTRDRWAIARHVIDLRPPPAKPASKKHG